MWGVGAVCVPTQAEKDEHICISLAESCQQATLLEELQPRAAHFSCIISPPHTPQPSEQPCQELITVFSPGESSSSER